MLCPCHACRLRPRQRKPHTLLPQHLLQHDRARGCMAVDVECLNDAGEGGVVVALGHHHAAVAGGAHAHTHTHGARSRYHPQPHRHQHNNGTHASSSSSLPCSCAKALAHTRKRCGHTRHCQCSETARNHTHLQHNTHTHVRWCCANGDDDSSPRLAVRFTQLGGMTFALARLTTCGRALVRRAIARPNTATLAWGGCRCARL